MQPVTIVQGGAYGSEGKGVVAAYLAEHEKFDVVVRTGAVNAGHTVYHNHIPYKMCQLPTAWVVPGVKLVIGAGALVHPEILKAEVAMIRQATGEDIRDRLFIDPNAGIHDASHTGRSTASGRHYAIGATGKGSSEALIDKIRLRGKGYKTFGSTPHKTGYKVVNTADMLNYEIDKGRKVMLEATQGTLLDLHTGPYPYTTHKSTLPANWMAECGLSPTLPVDVVMVVRTYPIRVAGNSGPMSEEISWPTLARGINESRRRHGTAPIVGDWAIVAFEQAVQISADRFDTPYRSNGLDQHYWSAAEREKYAEALSEIHADALKNLSMVALGELSKLFELTTVTKKLRRVARLTRDDLRWAALLCRPTRVFVTFMNYEFPEIWYTDPGFEVPARLNIEQTGYLQNIEVACNAPVTHVSWGPESEHVLKTSEYAVNTTKFPV